MLHLFDGQDPYIHLTSNQKGWVIDVTYIAVIFGSISSFPFVKTFGLKGTMAISIVPKILSWLIIGLAQNYWLLLAGRFLAGIGYSISYYIVPLYVGEVTSKTIRGPIGTLAATSYDLGEMIVNLASVWLDRRQLSFALVIVPFTFLLGLYWLPPSPTHLLKKNQLTEAKKVLVWLGEKNVDNRIREIQSALSNEADNSKRMMELLKAPQSIKSFYLAGLLIFCNVGYLSITSYEYYVFAGSGFNVNFCINLSASLPILVCFLCMGIVKYTGKRKIILTSISLACLSLLILAVYYSVQSLKVNTSSYRWIPTVFTIIYLTSCEGGYYTMLMSYMGEIFPHEVKSVTLLYCTVTTAVRNAVTIKFYQVIVTYYW